MAKHVFLTHTVAKVKTVDSKVALLFLSDDMIEPLLNEQRIRIKHEFSSVDELLLTAKPEELYRFLAKFNEVTPEESWEDLAFHLTPSVE